jgi:hypothetical protein
MSADQMHTPEPNTTLLRALDDFGARLEQCKGKPTVVTLDERETIEAAFRAIQRLTEQRARLLAALQPFADLAELFDDGKRGGNMPSTGAISSWPRLNKDYELTVEHLRTARATIAECQP